VPSTVFAAGQLEATGAVRWGEGVPEARSGVYAVALSANREEPKTLTIAPVWMAAVGELLAGRPEPMLDGARPSARALAERIASFWLPDETIVYVGLAGTSVRTRVATTTRRGSAPVARMPGRWFIKSLANVNDLLVHFAPRARPAGRGGSRSRTRWRSPTVATPSSCAGPTGGSSPPAPQETKRAAVFPRATGAGGPRLLDLPRCG